jgi:hypothetical protein
MFFIQVYLFTRSLRTFGGAFRDAPVVVTVGHDPVDRSLTENIPWARELGVEFRWVSSGLFRRYSYAAQAHSRFCYDYKSDVVLFADADTLVAGPFEDMALRAARHQSLCACLAHLSPFPTFRSKLGWNDIFRYLRVRKPRLGHQYAGWPSMSGRCAERWCPPYFNFGVVFAPRDLVRRIGERIYLVVDRLHDLEPNAFNGQIALTALIVDLKMRYYCMPFRYNAANWPALPELYPREVKDARILHLISGKNEIFRNWDAVFDFLKQDGPKGINARAQDVLGAIAPPGNGTIADGLSA